MSQKPIDKPLNYKGGRKVARFLRSKGYPVTFNLVYRKTPIELANSLEFQPAIVVILATQIYHIAYDIAGYTSE